MLFTAHRELFYGCFGSLVSYLSVCVCVCTELKEAQKKKQQMRERFKQEDSIVNAMVVWNTEVLPNWDSM